MNGKNLLIGLSHIDRKFIEESEMDTLSPGKPARKLLRKPLLIAAIIALMLLLVGCVAYVLNLDNLILAKSSQVQPAHFDENGEIVPETEIPTNFISLQGIAGSPNYLATQEWQAFEAGYDTVKAAGDADAVGFQRPEQYQAYSVYNQEMMDQIDAIAEKYGLELLGPIALFQSYENHIFFESLKIDSLLLPDAQAKVEYGSGYFYPGGNFSISFFQSMTGEGQWPYSTLNSMRFCGKQYLDTVYTVIGDTSNYEQWNYTTASGTPLLILQGETFARIFCDRDDAFLTISLDTYHENNDGTKVFMTKEQLLQIVESFDYNIAPQKTDLSLAKAELEQFNPELYYARQEAMMETYVDPYAQEGYDAYIRNLLITPGNAENLCYALADINGDGIEELLLGDISYPGYEENSFIEAITLKDGITQLGFTTSMPSYVCENNTILCHEVQEYAELYGFYVLSPGYGDTGLNVESYTSLSYRKIDSSWHYNENFSGEEVLSDAAASEVIDSYKIRPLEMKPISEFPLS